MYSSYISSFGLEQRYDIYWTKIFRIGVRFVLCKRLSATAYKTIFTNYILVLCKRTMNVQFLVFGVVCLKPILAYLSVVTKCYSNRRTQRNDNNHLALCYYAQYTTLCLHEARMVFLAMCLLVSVLCVHWYFFIERFCDFFESNRSLAHSAIYLTKHTRFKPSENRYSAFRDCAALYVCAVVMFFFFYYLFINWILFSWLQYVRWVFIAQTARNELVYC